MNQLETHLESHRELIVIHVKSRMTPPGTVHESHRNEMGILTGTIRNPLWTHNNPTCMLAESLNKPIWHPLGTPTRPIWNPLFEAYKNPFELILDHIGIQMDSTCNPTIIKLESNWNIPGALWTSKQETPQEPHKKPYNTPPPPHTHTHTHNHLHFDKNPVGILQDTIWDIEGNPMENK